MVYAVGIIDQSAAGFYFRLELVEALLVENNGCVIGVEHRAADRLIGKNYSHIGCASALLRSVGWHPCDLKIVHQPCIGEDFAH